MDGFIFNLTNGIPLWKHIIRLLLSWICFLKSPEEDQYREKGQNKILFWERCRNRDLLKREAKVPVASPTSVISSMLFDPICTQQALLETLSICFLPLLF